jgi:Ca2+-binding RTX toxin-like protein
MEPVRRLFPSLVEVKAGRRSLGCVAAAAAAVALLPPAAGASTASADGITVTFQAAPGERNVPSFAAVGDRLEVSDSGSSVSAGPGCTIEDGRVLCPGTQVVVHAGDEADTVILTKRGERSFDAIYGEEGDDTLTGEAFGGPGNDTLTALDGDDLDGGPGDDVLSASGNGGTFSGGDGDDRLTAPFLYGGGNGGDGDDVLDSSTRQMTGGAGNDRLMAHACLLCFFHPTLDGGEGNDELLGSSVSDVLLGGPGADVIRADATEEAGPSLGELEVLSGGPGDDLLYVGGDRFPDPLPIGYTITGLTPPEDQPSPVSTVDGGQGDDRLEGGPNRDLLAGGEGDDYIDGGDGFDALSGDEGSDELHGGEGNDRLDGGPAPDVIDGGQGEGDGADLSGSAWAVDIDLTRPGGDGPPGENDTYLPGVELFELTGFADRFVAGRLPVSVSGGFGDDVLIGGPSRDVLVGDPSSAPPGSPFGDDRLDGRGGADKLFGEAGIDMLSGGSGDDHLDGGRPVVYYQGTVTRYPSDNTISGGAGSDAILNGGQVTAGRGDDRINVSDFQGTNMSPVIPLGRDGTVRCGPGRDRVKGDFYDGLGLDCETIWEGAGPWHTARPDRHGRVTLTVRCAWDYSAGCRGKARLVRTASQTVAFLPKDPPKGCRKGAGALSRGHSFRLRAGRVNRVTIQLSPRARRALGRAGCLLVRADLRFRDPKGVSHEMTRTLALRPPR